MPLARISGSPVLIEMLLYKPKHSLIDQSLHSTMGAETTNGDGFGVGWCRPTHPASSTDRAGLERPQPAGARAAHPLAHRLRPHPRIERQPGPADELSSLPPRPWLWMHNGVIRDFQRSSATWSWRSIPSSTHSSRGRPLGDALLPGADSASRRTRHRRSRADRPRRGVGHEHGVESRCRGRSQPREMARSLFSVFRLLQRARLAELLSPALRLDALRELYPTPRPSRRWTRTRGRPVSLEPPGLHPPGCVERFPELSYGSCSLAGREYDSTPVPPTNICLYRAHGRPSNSTRPGGARLRGR